nr:hypothetical protein [Nonomuraea basaltis]
MLAGGHPADQVSDQRDGGGDLLGADLEAGQDVSARAPGRGEEAEVGERVVGERVVAAGVEVQAAGAGDVAERAQVTGGIQGECGGAGEPVGDHRVAEGDAVPRSNSQDFERPAQPATENEPTTPNSERGVEGN